MSPSRQIRIGVVVAAIGVIVGALALSLSVPGWVLKDESMATETQAAADGVVSVVIPAGASATEVAHTLADAGVIDSPRRFETLVALLGYAPALAAGTYDFSPGMLTMDVIERIRQGVTSPLVVTIPEGVRLEEIAARVEAAGVVGAAAFLDAARDPTVAAGTLAAARPAGTSLEGYLFPGTYRVSLRATAGEIVRQMLEQFDHEMTDDRREAIRASGRTLHEVLTMASIVEREAVRPEEQAIIASVFWNRIEQGMRLEADPTVQYALAADARSVAAFGYWKSPLQQADLVTDSPSNTYVREGLPPTPIAAPGLGALDAAIRPAETSYLFFVARGDGSHAFAVTFAEHQSNVERYADGGGT